MESGFQKTGEHLNEISCLSFSNNKQLFLSGSYKKIKNNGYEFINEGLEKDNTSVDSSIKIYDLNTSKEIYSYSIHSGKIYNAKFTMNDKYIVSSSDDKTIKIFDFNEKKEIYSINNNFNAIGFDCLENIIAYSSENNQITLFDINSQKVISILSGHTEYINCLSFSPDRKFLASGGFDNSIKIWDLETQKEFCTLKGHKGTITSVVFFKDSDIIISGSIDNNIKIWNLKTKSEIFEINYHSNGISSLFVYNNYLISSSFDKTIKIWDIYNKKEFFSLQTETIVNSIIYDDFNENLYIGTDDKNIYKYSLTNIINEQFKIIQYQNSDLNNDDFQIILNYNQNKLDLIILKDDVLFEEYSYRKLNYKNLINSITNQIYKHNIKLLRENDIPFIITSKDNEECYPDNIREDENIIKIYNENTETLNRSFSKRYIMNMVEKSESNISIEFISIKEEVKKINLILSKDDLEDKLYTEINEKLFEIKELLEEINCLKQKIIFVFSDKYLLESLFKEAFEKVFFEYGYNHFSPSDELIKLLNNYSNKTKITVNDFFNRLKNNHFPIKAYLTEILKESENYEISLICDDLDLYSNSKNDGINKILEIIDFGEE